MPTIDRTTAIVEPAHHGAGDQLCVDVRGADAAWTARFNEMAAGQYRQVEVHSGRWGLGRYNEVEGHGGGSGDPLGGPPAGVERERPRSMIFTETLTALSGSI
jgi:hypothetical protein